jgi:hypothetical protein
VTPSENGRIEVAGHTFRNAEELRRHVHSMRAVREGRGAVTNTERALILECAARFPVPEPTPEELDRQVATIAARLDPRPAFEASPPLPSPFDERIAETEAARAEAETALEDAKTALELAKQADVRAYYKRGRLGVRYTGPSEEASRLAVDEAREAYEAADRAWVRLNSRLHALSMAATRWRSENS